MGKWLLRPTVKILAILIYGLPLTKKKHVVESKIIYG